MSEDVLDEALELLAATGPLYGSAGLVNHGPMAAEALLRLGRDRDVVPWVRRYAARLEPAPEIGEAVADADWEAALGAYDRFNEWLQRFRDDLRERDWPDVVSVWAPRMVPGLAAAALHGIIETAHAVRALEKQMTALRLDELARGLALWASTYQTLAGTRSAGGSRARDAIDHVALLSHDERKSFVSLDDGLKAAADSPGFADVIGRVDASADPARTLDDLISTFVGVTNDQAHDALSAIVFVHTVTGPAAVELLLDYLDADMQTAAIEYAWQASAGLYVAFATEPQPTDAMPPVTASGAVDRAVAGGDEHAIKFAEAALRANTDTATRAAAIDRVAALLSED